MSGTRIGGINASKTNKSKYGKDFYRKIGAMGGKIGRTGGFFANRELAREAGRKGGLKSRRGKAKDPQTIINEYVMEQNRKDGYDENGNLNE